MKPDFENEAMMAIDWAVRDRMFLDRLRALEGAMDRQRGLLSLVKGAAMMSAFAGVVLTHASTIGAWWRLAIALGAWLVVRLSGRFALHAWSARTMARIEREHPKPPKLPIGDW